LRKSLGAILLVLVLSLGLVPIAAVAHIPSDDPNLDSVYVDVLVLPNGRINVTYWMTFTAASGGLGGFDLLGIEETTLVDVARAYAEWGGNRYNLIIGQRSGGYALDWTPRTPEGQQVLVVFGYFSTNRVVELTTSPTYGELGVLNWAPVQWSIAVDYEQVQVIYPIEINPSWIESSHGVTPEGAEHAGYIEDENQGLWRDSARYPFDNTDLLAYPYDIAASPRYFTVSMDFAAVNAYDHFRIFQYTNWTFYAAFAELGALDYTVNTYVNAQANTQFQLELNVFNYGDLQLENVTILMTLPENLTLVSGSVLTPVGVLTGGDPAHRTARRRGLDRRSRTRQ